MMALPDDLVSTTCALLGDSTHYGTPNVDAWLSAVEQQQRQALDDSTNKFAWFRLRLELACALLYDARFGRAITEFQNVNSAFQTEPHSAERVLSLLGLGRAFNLLRRHPRADNSLQRALVAARQASQPDLEEIARSFISLNRWDWGRATDDAPDEVPFDSEDTRVAPLLLACHVLADARCHLRAGRRPEGLLSLQRFIDTPTFKALPPIPQGLLARTRGIFHAVLGRTAAARTDLEDAIGIFRSAGYRLGEVQAALSLAEVNAPVDHEQTMAYLARAKRILNEETDSAEVDGSNGRQMPAERAKLLSRLAKLEFMRGNLDEAVRYAFQDVALVTRLAGSETSTPRVLAHARRNLGKILLAKGKLDDASDNLATSAQLFEQVGDKVHLFFCLAELAEVYLAKLDFTRVDETLAELETVLSDLPGERDKERAIGTVLRASYYWKVQGDPEIALEKLRSAEAVLRDYGRDYYYARALIAEAEILLKCDDEVGARHKLREARRCANSLDVDELRKLTDDLLRRAGIGAAAVDHEGRFSLTVLYADIRGFTAACSHVDATAMAEFIGEFAVLASRCSARHAGRPVRFLGDCVVTLFGLDDRTVKKECVAVQCAAEMHRLFRGLCSRWAEKAREFEHLGHLGLGFGLATGDVIVGRFGSGDLSEYSVVGGAANMAARLQAAADDGELVMCTVTAGTSRTCFSEASLSEIELAPKGLGVVRAFRLSVAEAERMLQAVDRHLIRAEPSPLFG